MFILEKEKEKLRELKVSRDSHTFQRWNKLLNR